MCSALSHQKASLCPRRRFEFGIDSRSHPIARANSCASVSDPGQPAMFVISGTCCHRRVSSMISAHCCGGTALSGNFVFVLGGSLIGGEKGYSPSAPATPRRRRHDSRFMADMVCGERPEFGMATGRSWRSENDGAPGWIARAMTGRARRSIGQRPTERGLSRNQTR